MWPRPERQSATANNPIQTSVNTVTRTWTDTNGNYVPDCDLGNRGANGECGAIANQNFGRSTPATSYADDVLRGFGARDSNWDLSAEVQHQLRPGMSVTAGYYRNWYDHFLVTDNLAAATPADYSPYCITAPVDPRLPGGGGYPVCGLYDVSPAKFGQVNNLVTQASNFGERKLVNDFFNVTLNTRFGSNLQFGGAVDTGRTVNDVCFNVDSPGANATALPGVSATPAPFTATTINGQPHLPGRHAVQGPDAGQDVLELPVAGRHRGQRRLPEPVWASHHRRAMRRVTRKSRRRWAATWRRAAPGPCAPPRPRSRWWPPRRCSRAGAPDSTSG